MSDKKTAKAAPKKEASQPEKVAKAAPKKKEEPLCEFTLSVGEGHNNPHLFLVKDLGRKEKASFPTLRQALGWLENQLGKHL